MDTFLDVTEQPPIPQGLKLPYPKSPWKVSDRLFKEFHQQHFDPAIKFKMCEVQKTDLEHDFVLRNFMHSKPEKYHIGKLVCVHNPSITDLFISKLDLIEDEAGKYKPMLSQDAQYEQRMQTLSRWQDLTRQFYPLEIERRDRVDTLFKTQVLPLWHGSSEEKCRSICASGFSSFGKHHFFSPDAEKDDMPSTDRGYFGSGKYFTTSAKYANMYSRGHMLLALVSMRTPYPVVSDVLHPNKCTDMTMLEGRDGYQKYNAHYIPVASTHPNNPLCMEYYPCYKNQKAAWDEFVVFETAQALPRFWVILAPDLVKTISPIDLPYQQPDPGFNLEGKCNNSNCQINGKKIVIPKGFGEFDVGKESFQTLCPCCHNKLKATETIILKDCTYSYLGVNQNEGKVEHKNPQLNGTIRLDIFGWKFMNITVSQM